MNGELKKKILDYIKRTLITYSHDQGEIDGDECFECRKYYPSSLDNPFDPQYHEKDCQGLALIAEVEGVKGFKLAGWLVSPISNEVMDYKHFYRWRDDAMNWIEQLTCPENWKAIPLFTFDEEAPHE